MDQRQHSMLLHSAKRNHHFGLEMEYVKNQRMALDIYFSWIFFASSCDDISKHAAKKKQRNTQNLVHGNRNAEVRKFRKLLDVTACVRMYFFCSVYSIRRIDAA